MHIPQSLRNKFKKFRIIIFIVGLCLIFFLTFYLFIIFRGAKELRRDLSEILPADTLFYLSIRNLDKIIGDVEESEFFKYFQKSSLYGILQLSGSYRHYQKNKEEWESDIRQKIDREFIKKWFGKHTILAVISSEDEIPGLIIMSRTGIGFEEKLAELIAQYFPLLKLEKYKYKNILITAYKDKKVEKSLFYIRFGQTIILSIMTKDDSYIKRIIDLALSKNSESLATNPEFDRNYRIKYNDEGVEVYIKVNDLWEKLFNNDESRKYIEQKMKPELQFAVTDFLSQFHTYVLSLKIKKNIFVNWKYTFNKDYLFYDVQKAYPMEKYESRLIRYVDKDAMLFFVHLPIEWAYKLGIEPKVGREIRGLPIYFKSILDDMKKEYNVDIENSIVPRLDNEIAMIATPLDNPNLIPFSSLVFIKVKDKKAIDVMMNKLLKEIAKKYKYKAVLFKTTLENCSIQYLNIMFGLANFGYTFIDDYLVIMINIEGLNKALKVSRGALESIADNNEYQGAKKDFQSKTNTQIYIDFKKLSKITQNSSALKSYIMQISDEEKLNTVLAILDAIGHINKLSGTDVNIENGRVCKWIIYME